VSDAPPQDLESAVAGVDRHRDIVPERFICNGLGNRMLPQTPATYRRLRARLSTDTFTQLTLVGMVLRERPTVFLCSGVRGVNVRI